MNEYGEFNCYTCLERVDNSIGKSLLISQMMTLILKDKTIPDHRKEKDSGYVVHHEVQWPYGAGAADLVCRLHGNGGKEWTGRFVFMGIEPPITLVFYSTSELEYISTVSTSTLYAERHPMSTENPRSAHAMLEKVPHPHAAIAIINE